MISETRAAAKPRLTSALQTRCRRRCRGVPALEAQSFANARSRDFSSPDESASASAAAIVSAEKPRAESSRSSGPGRLPREIKRRLFRLHRVEVARRLQLGIHFLARQVGGGLDSLNLELELVGVGGAPKGFFQSDQAGLIELVEGLIEGL